MHGIFHLESLFLPLTTYQHQLMILILFQFFFKQACHANPGADNKCTGSISYTLIHMQ